MTGDVNEEAPFGAFLLGFLPDFYRLFRGFTGCCFWEIVVARLLRQCETANQKANSGVTESDSGSN
jgi:hypothetical protein